MIAICSVIVQRQIVVSVTGIPGLPGCAVPARPPVKVSALIANYRSYTHCLYILLSLLTTAVTHHPSAVSFVIFSLYLNSYSLFFVVLKIQCYDTLTMEIKILKMYGVNHRLPIAQS